MKILLTGANGFLGRKITEVLSKRYQLILTGIDKDIQNFVRLDITNVQEVKKTLAKHRPDAIIHTAAITDVDYCEENREKAYTTNVLGTKNLVDNFQGLFVYISTDFVFDGTIGNYKEEDTAHPQSYYARTKLEGEELVQKGANPYIIARVAVLYGYDPKNKKYVQWAIEQMKAGKKVNAIVDNYRTPTLIDDVAKALSFLIEHKKTGIYHVSGSERLSSYEMALQIAKIFKFSKGLIQPIAEQSLNLKAQRPVDSSLDTDKIKKLGIKMSNFSKGLKSLKIQMEARK